MGRPCPSTEDAQYSGVASIYIAGRKAYQRKYLLPNSACLQDLAELYRRVADTHL